MTNEHSVKLSAAELYRASDLDEIVFDDTRDLSGRGSARHGQDRAVDAVHFGLEMADDGYNIFVLGPAGSDRHEMARSIANEHAQKQPPPPDWCYVNNFDDPVKPRALRFAAGQGTQFRNDMNSLIEELRLAIPAVFESDDYRKQLKAVEKETERRIEAEHKTFEASAKKEDINVLQTPTGFVLAPTRDDKVLSDEEFNALPEEERQQIQEKIERLSKQLQTHIEKMPRIRKDHIERIKALDRDVMTIAIGLPIAELKKRYAQVEAALVYLDDVEQNIINDAQGFRQTEAPSLPFLNMGQGPSFSRYEVNLLIDNADSQGAPVVYEPNPNYPNIIGKIEHHAELGALVTDFRLIRGGALHAASGGYLLIDAWRMLSRPFVWEALKQSLLAKTVRIESPGESYGLLSTTALQPAPIPLDVKIIMIGERWLYYLMAQNDPEFNELFKVAADLEDDLERTANNTQAAVFLIADVVNDKGLRPFRRDAVARVIEQRARRADDSERLSTHMRSLVDLLQQSNHWAGRRDAATVESEDVEHAIAARIHRADRAQRRLLDAIERDVLLIDTSGERVGQVNGLAVSSLGEYRFGHPIRITATTRIGSGEVVDVEREVELGGAVHSKGVLILSSALAARYAADMPLSLAASIVFEQSYAGIDGDSASVAELCALLSSISGVPIKQNLAVTGSINQLGRVQVIGGINEKIEGFFDVCKARDLDGRHGVVIPRDNVKHLMLRDDVVAAVAAGQFSVFAVRSIDEAVTLLTGVEAGERNAQGKFEQGTVNYKVEQQLLHYAQARQAFSSKAKARQ
jgi:lon-related putative ATP-dependent protease